MSCSKPRYPDHLKTEFRQSFDSPLAKQVVHAWNEGMASLCDPKKPVALRGLDVAIAAAGFSEPVFPEQAHAMIGRSELLAQQRGQRYQIETIQEKFC